MLRYTDSNWQNLNPRLNRNTKTVTAVRFLINLFQWHAPFPVVCITHFFNPKVHLFLFIFHHIWWHLLKKESTVQYTRELFFFSLIFSHPLMKLFKQANEMLQLWIFAGHCQGRWYDHAINYEMIYIAVCWYWMHRIQRSRLHDNESLMCNRTQVLDNGQWRSKVHLLGLNIRVFGQLWYNLHSLL